MRSAVEVVRIRWDGDARAQTGLSARQLAATLKPELWRSNADFFAQVNGSTGTPVRVTRQGAESLQLDTLKHLPLVVTAEKQTRLAAHAEIFLAQDPPSIERIDQQYRRTLRVYYRGDFRQGYKMLGQELRAFPLPAGYRLTRPEAAFFCDEVSWQLVGLIFGAIGLVFLLVAAVLESWHLAAVVVLSLPLSWIGIASAFLATGHFFAEGAFLGIVMVIGIGVNNTILLVDGYRRLRLKRPGAPAQSLSLVAFKRRLKPMWITTLTSLAGMLPMLVFPGAGHFWQGLAITVVGGLIATTLLTPIATVALLSGFDYPRPAARPLRIARLGSAPQD